MEKSTKGDKLAAAIFSSVLACLFTGGIAATVGFSLPITLIITVGVVFSIAYSNAED